MPSSVRANFTVRSQDSELSGKALLAGILLLAAAVFLLWQGFSFGVYALTGILWARTDGVVINPVRTSTPVIRFSSLDGASHQFSEDYILLCGSHRSLCLVRDFNPGQVVPVVYEPAAPHRAFIHDWALFAGVLTWFTEAGAGLLIAFLMCAALVRRPVSFSVRVGERRES